jgi:Fe-S cluster assembly ATP-binding protein
MNKFTNLQIHEEILKGINFSIEKGKVYALMGPNGSGKSTLAYAIMGHPNYKVCSGKIIFNGEDITELSVDERARKGIFLSFQNPKEIPGVSVANFLKSALRAQGREDLSASEIYDFLQEKMRFLGFESHLLRRHLNEGFSGGEKKMMEILQLLVLNPRLAILDELDSGLDIDALRSVARGIHFFVKENKSLLIITHYKRLLEYVKPDRLIVFKDGKVVLEEDGQFVDELESKGYGFLED